MKKRIFALIMSVCMLISMMPISAIASDHVHDTSCGYVEAKACDHSHNTECGYAEAVEDAACGHNCADGTCAYAEAVAAQECQHIHGDCSFVAAVAGQPCGHTHGDCSYREAVSGSSCNHAHDGSCGYAEAVAGTSCGHNCASDGCPVNEDGSYACQHSAHDSSCGYSEGTPGSACGHTCESGGDCGYVAAKDAVPCDHVCENGGSCGFVAAVDGVDCDHSHNDACGYAAAKDAVPCDHACVSGGACGFVQAIPASDCLHHCDDGTCSYSEGSECTYVEPPVEETGHTHVWSEEWANNGTTHWHECTAAGCDLPVGVADLAKSGYGDHSYDSNYTCTTCGYTCPHSGAETNYNMDSTHHWGVCGNGTCGYTTDKEAHDQNGANGSCSVCYYDPNSSTDPGVHTHEWGDWTANGDGTHTHTCKVDPTHTETADCAVHTYASVDEQNHNILCECFSGENYYVLGTEAHTMSEWVRDGEFDRRECTKHCDYYEEREHTHDWSNYTYKGNGVHTRNCTAEGCTSQQTSTCGGMATCHELAFCPECKTTYGEYDQKIIPAVQKSAMQRMPPKPRMDIPATHIALAARRCLTKAASFTQRAVGTMMTIPIPTITVTIITMEQITGKCATVGKDRQAQ